MIQDRLRKAHRLLGVQRDLQRLEETKVAALRSRQAELVAMQEEILGALNREDGLHDRFLGAIVRRLKSLSEEAAGVGQELERRLLLLRTQAGRTKYAERRSRAYEQQDARERAQKELLEVIEQVIRRKDASLP